MFHFHYSFWTNDVGLGAAREDLYLPGPLALSSQPQGSLSAVLQREMGETWPLGSFEWSDFYGKG